MEDRERDPRAGRSAPAHRALLRDDAAPRIESTRVRALRADDAGGRPARQHGRLDRGSRRRARLRQAPRPHVPTRPHHLRSVADRGARRCRLHDPPAVHAALRWRWRQLHPRQPARAPGGKQLRVRRADLRTVAAEQHSGAAARNPRDAGQGRDDRLVHEVARGPLRTGHRRRVAQSVTEPIAFAERDATRLRDPGAVRFTRARTDRRAAREVRIRPLRRGAGSAQNR